MDLVDNNTRIKVSSVLNKDTKNYGKQHLIDGNEETCWNSESGLPQYIMIQLSAPSKLNQIKINFQGGFVGKVGEVWTNGNSESLEFKENCYFEDVNNEQVWTLGDSIKEDSITQLKIVFNESSDFFGRITIYHLKLIGNKI